MITVKMLNWFRRETVQDSSDTKQELQEATEVLATRIFQDTFGTPYIQTPWGKRFMITADSTASGSYYRPIEDFITRNVAPYYNNTHSNAFGGQMMNHYIQQSKDKIATSFGIKGNKDYHILFTGNGSTGTIQHVIHMLDLRSASADAVVFITEAEHHSNDLPWRHLPIQLVVIPMIGDTGIVDTSLLESELAKYQSKRTRLISFIGCSNITGVIQPIEEVSRIGHRYGALVMFDFATGSPYLPIRMVRNERTGNYIDIVSVSTHKFLGGPNTPGVLVFRTSACRNDVPFCPGGGTVRFVTRTTQRYSDDVETRENGGTPNIVGSIRAGLAFALKDKYQDHITKREEWLVDYAQRRLVALGDRIELLNPLANRDRIAIFSFRVPGFHYNYIVTLLNDLFGIQSRGGVSCCSMYAQKLLRITKQQKQEIADSIVNNRGVPAYYGWCRITFHYTMTKPMVDYILDAVDFVSRMAPRFQRFYKYEPRKNLWYFQDPRSAVKMERMDLLEGLIATSLELQREEITIASPASLQRIREQNETLAADIQTL